MISFKITNGSDIRRISVEEPISSYSSLVTLAKQTFGSSFPKEKFVFKYKDEDGDNISVTSDRDLEEAFKYLSIDSNNNNKQKSLKLEIVQPNSCCFNKFFQDDNCHLKIKEFITRKKTEFCEKRKKCNLNGNGKKGCRIFKKVLFALVLLFLCTKCCFLSIFLLLGAVGFCCAKKFCKRTCSSFSKSGSDYSCPIFGNCSTNQNPIRNENNIQNDVNNNNQKEEEEEVKRIVVKNEKELPFQSKLKQLEEMGFASRTNNIEALINNNGDVLQTVKELLEKKN